MSEEQNKRSVSFDAVASKTGRRAVPTPFPTQRRHPEPNVTFGGLINSPRTGSSGNLPFPTPHPKVYTQFQQKDETVQQPLTPLASNVPQPKDEKSPSKKESQEEQWTSPPDKSTEDTKTPIATSPIIKSLCLDHQLQTNKTPPSLRSVPVIALSSSARTSPSPLPKTPFFTPLPALTPVSTGGSRFFRSHHGAGKRMRFQSPDRPMVVESNGKGADLPTPPDLFFCGSPSHVNICELCYGLLDNEDKPTCLSCSSEAIDLGSLLDRCNPFKVALFSPVPIEKKLYRKFPKAIAKPNPIRKDAYGSALKGFTVYIIVYSDEYSRHQFDTTWPTREEALLRMRYLFLAKNDWQPPTDLEESGEDQYLVMLPSDDPFDYWVTGVMTDKEFFQDDTAKPYEFAPDPLSPPSSETTPTQDDKVEIAGETVETTPLLP